MFYEALEGRRFFSVTKQVLNADYAAILAARSQIAAAIRNQQAIVVAANKTIKQDIRAAHATAAAAKNVAALVRAENQGHSAVLTQEKKLSSRAAVLSATARQKGFTYLRKTGQTKGLRDITPSDATPTDPAGAIAAALEQLNQTVNFDTAAVDNSEETGASMVELMLQMLGDEAFPDDPPAQADVTTIEEEIGQAATTDTPATGSVEEVETAVDDYDNTVATLANHLNTLITPTSPSSSLATLPAHVGSVDPIHEGNTVSSVGTANAAAVANDQGLAAFSLASTAVSTQWVYVSGALPAAQKTSLANSGFSITSVMRVSRGLAPAYTSDVPTYLGGFAYDDGAVRWELDLGVDGNGNTVAILPTTIGFESDGSGALYASGQSYTITGSGYHAYSLVYNSSSHTASLNVDGVPKLTGYTGETAYVANVGLEFGVVSGGAADFNLVAMGQASASGQHLQFIGGASTASAGQTLTPPIAAAVEDANGSVVTTASPSVSITSTSGTLGGTTTVTAQNGVAVFTDLTESSAGSYALVVSDSANDADATSAQLIVG